MPTALPVTEVTMNYASVVLVGFLALAGLWYVLHARKGKFWLWSHLGTLADFVASLQGSAGIGWTWEVMIVYKCLMLEFALCKRVLMFWEDGVHSLTGTRNCTYLLVPSF